MAGLVLNSKKRAMPTFPAPDTSLQPYFGAAHSYAARSYLPGFNGGTAGRSIMIPMNSNSSNLIMYDIEGATVNNGSWASGLTVAEAAGSANAETWVGFWMDNTDAMLYMLTSDKTTNPDTFYFSKINEAGTITAIGNAQLTQAHHDNMYHNTTSTQGKLRRLGGDGSGNFSIYNTYGAGGTAAAGAPYRGVDIQISASNGALSYSNMMPATFGDPYYLLGMNLGPTDNNIIGGFYSLFSPISDGPTGGIANTSNGKGYYLISLGSFHTNGVIFGAAVSNPVQWREKYVFTGGGQAYGPQIYDRNDIHRWLDQVAEYYGIL
tara:strand:+ start:87 stop:1049 length:963 start_codon:yes stop_codon:yes gene_type:complete